MQIGQKDRGLTALAAPALNIVLSASFLSCISGKLHGLLELQQDEMELHKLVRPPVLLNYHICLI